jgi:hypothetical protein
MSALDGKQFQAPSDSLHDKSSGTHLTGWTNPELSECDDGEKIFSPVKNRNPAAQNVATQHSD